MSQAMKSPAIIHGAQNHSPQFVTPNFTTHQMPAITARKMAVSKTLCPHMGMLATLPRAAVFWE